MLTVLVPLLVEGNDGCSFASCTHKFGDFATVKGKAVPVLN
jgi:hypothetical protein